MDLYGLTGSMKIGSTPNINLLLSSTAPSGASLYMFEPIITQNNSQATLYLHGWLYENNQTLNKIFAGILGNQPGLFNSRINYFKKKGINSVNVTLRLPWNKQVTTQTDNNGHFYLKIDYPYGLTRSNLSLRFRNQSFLLNPNLIVPRSISRLIISDIDDTIRDVDVPSRINSFNNIFLKPFRPIPGMSDLYRRFTSINNNQVFYVSGGPWQLYPATYNEFLSFNNFPDPQSLFMRSVVPTNLAGLRDAVKSFSTEKFKQKTITYILNTMLNFKKSVILIGDEGERDPEVYNYINQVYPNVDYIFIRVLDGSRNEKEPRVLSRFNQATQPKVFTFSTGDQLIKYLMPRKVLKASSVPYTYRRTNRPRYLSRYWSNELKLGHPNQKSLYM